MARAETHLCTNVCAWQVSTSHGVCLTWCMELSKQCDSLDSLGFGDIKLLDKRGVHILFSTKSRFYYELGEVVSHSLEVSLLTYQDAWSEHLLEGDCGKPEVGPFLFAFPPFCSPPLLPPLSLGFFLPFFCISFWYWHWNKQNFCTKSCWN